MNVSLKTLMATAAVALAGGTAVADGKPDGKTFLLTVSVSDSPKLPKYRALPHADRAADRLHDALLAMVPADRRNGYRLSLSRGESNHPTTEKVRAVLKRFAREATKDDRVVVAFVGHGFENRDGAALVLADSDLADPASFLAVAELVGRVRAIRCKEACVFVDACRNFRDDVTVAAATDYRKAAGRFDDEERRAAGTAKERPVVVVQACDEGQYAYERPGEAGLMTERLIEALGARVEAGKAKPERSADADGDGRVTVREAVEYVRKAVRDEARQTHGQLQSVTVNSSGEESFALATVNGLTPAGPGTGGGTGGTGTGGTAAATPAPRAELAFGALPTPAAPANYRGTAVGFGGAGGGVNGYHQQQTAGNVMFGGGFDPRGPVGYGLGVARQYAPAPAQQYLPQPGVSLLEFGLGFIRR